MLREKIINNMDLYKDKCAVSYNGKETTYLDLKRKAIAVAEGLKDNKYYGKNCGVFFSNGDLGIIALLGCLFAGVTYVPIDEEQISENIKYILKNSEINIILTDKAGIKRLEEKQIEARTDLCVIDIEENALKYSDKKSVFTDKNQNPIMYHLYTSGSTGRPKAIEQTEESVFHFISAYIDSISLLYSDNMTLFSTFGHDAAVIDIFSCLLTGASLFPRDLRNIRNIVTLPRWLKDNKITIWHSVPSFYRKFFANYGKKCTEHMLRRIVLGGEMVRRSDFGIFNRINHSESIGFYNLYGQTESSYTAGRWIKKEEDCEILGEPIPDTSIIIKKQDGEFIIIGENLNQDELIKLSGSEIKLEEGEIAIVSQYIAKGYLNEPELTKKTFQFWDDEKVIYKTGDFVDIEYRFLGRKDGQCKINGFRVELGVIENALLEFDGIEDCVVFPREYNGQLRIFGALKTKISCDLKDINLFLLDKVPQYMLLYSVKRFDEFPITITGKINRKEIERTF